MKLTKKVARLIERERVCRIATSGAAGVPHLVPVCPVVAGGKIYVGTGNKGRKVKNLRENPRIAVTVDIYTEDWDRLMGVMVQGTARLIEKGPRFRAIRDRLYAKYPQYRTDAALSPSDALIVEITPTHVFTWGLD